MTAWDPYAEEYPPRPDAEQLRSHARALDEKAEDIDDAVELIESDWSGLEAVYKSPESAQVYAAVKPIKTTTEDIKSDTAAIKAAIETFADWADTFKSRYEELKSRWYGVRARISDEGDDWRKDEDLVNDDNQILKDANALAAEHMEAERACHNAITALYGGVTLVQTTQEGPGDGQKAYGYSAEQLDSATGEGHIPWGEPTEWDKPWYKDVWDGMVSFGKGVWSGITGTVTGLWNMVNFTDGETFAATWKGIGKIALNVAIVSSPITAAVAERVGGPGTVKQAGEELLAVGKAAIHWDDWKRDPAYAAGATAFDLSTILLTAGGGAVAKAGGVANKITNVSRAGGIASKVLDFSGLTRTAGVTTRAIDFSTNFKFTAIDVTTHGLKTVTNTVRPYVSTAGHAFTDGLRNASTGLRTGMDNITTSVRTSADNFANALGGPRVATAGGGSTAPHRFDVEMPSARNSSSTMNFDADGPKPSSGSTGYTVPDRSGPPQYGQRIETPETSNTPNRAPEPDNASNRTPEPDSAPNQTPEPGSTPSKTTEPGTDTRVNVHDVDGQRVDDDFRHPQEPQHGDVQPDVIRDQRAHETYGQHRTDDLYEDVDMPDWADRPDSIHQDLDGIVDRKQPAYGTDEFGDALARDEYANRYSQLDELRPDDYRAAYPDNAGAVEGSIRTYASLDELRADFGDLQLDRIGPNGGAYLAIEGTPWHMRSLPVDTLGKELHHFEFDAIPDGVRLEVSEIAPAFGRPGGGTQLRFLDAEGHAIGVDEMIRREGLRETGPHAFDRPWARNADNPVDLVTEHNLQLSSRKSVVDVVQERGLTLEPSTVYEVPGRGKFYTNSAGNIQQIEAVSGSKGNWNPELNNPQPNVRYHIDDNIVVHTDGSGRPTVLHAHDLEYFPKAQADTWRHTGNQNTIGGQGGTDYDGGHLLAAMFGGPGEKINLIPQLNIQNRNLGLGDLTPIERLRLAGNADTWYDTELWIRDQLRDVPAGGTRPSITWDVRPIYDAGSGNRVPHMVELKVTVDGQTRRFDFDN